eukprot:GHVU01142262.1.p1 GENE.GHVU01142262.1~~GHVU01142262.1.p1  ORF type:complete len:108 (+),score=0.18 GHVU01142262.1:194-517(+)
MQTFVHSGTGRSLDSRSSRFWLQEIRLWPYRPGLSFLELQSNQIRFLSPSGEDMCIQKNYSTENLTRRRTNSSQSVGIGSFLILASSVGMKITLMTPLLAGVSTTFV